MRKPPRVSLLATVTLVALSLGGYACRPDPQPTTSSPRVQQTPSPAAAPSPAYFQDAAAAGPAGLRLLSSGWFHDVDRGPQAARRVAVTGWLARWDRSPMLLDERTSAREFGRFRFSTRREPALPGTPSVTVVDRPALGSVAVAEGDDLWVEEYLSASNRSIRRVRPGGRTVQAPRKVPCGTQPLAQTAAGLWLAVGPDAISAARQAFGREATKAVLVDPATFAEQTTYAWVEPFDRHRAIHRLDHADRNPAVLRLERARRRPAERRRAMACLPVRRTRRGPAGARRLAARPADARLDAGTGDAGLRLSQAVGRRLDRRRASRGRVPVRGPARRGPAAALHVAAGRAASDLVRL